MPQRIQLKRSKGWRKPAGAVVVARPSVFGNPFTVADAIEVGVARTEESAVRICVESFDHWLRGDREHWMGQASDERAAAILERLPELRGKDLACWCPLDRPCHADVLLRVANESE